MYKRTAQTYVLTQRESNWIYKFAVEGKGGGNSDGSGAHRAPPLGTDPGQFTYSRLQGNSTGRSHTRNDKYCWYNLVKTHAYIHFTPHFTYTTVAQLWHAASFWLDWIGVTSFSNIHTQKKKGTGEIKNACSRRQVVTEQAHSQAITLDFFF